jgi:hypothetical protein
MEHRIPEPDWKIFRQLRLLALDRFCQRVLAEVSELAVDVDKSHHERYLAMFKLLHDRDDKLADMFNSPRRSVALMQLARIQSMKLLSTEELARFSPETRAALEPFREM